jgi:hypothetical protein
LQRTLLRLPTTTPNGTPGAVIVPVMAYRIEELEQDDKSMIWLEFTPQAREVLQKSDYYAALNRGVVLAMESRYACTLYERGCLLVSRRHPMWRGSVDDLREVMASNLAATRIGRTSGVRWSSQHVPRLTRSPTSR